MKKISQLPLLVLLLFLYSCEFEPSEVYNRKVNRDVPAPQIQVVELNLDTDTIFLYNSLEIKFEFQSSNQAITGVNFLLDGVSVGTVYSASGTFTLQTGQIAKGMHDLDIEVYTGAGTGSLADVLGVEGYVASQSWKLVMQDYYYPEISKSIENGFLHLTWNKYNASNFKEYVIYKASPIMGETEIKRVNTNEFTDSSYVGEWAYYYMRVITRDDITFSTNAFFIDSDLPVLSYSVEDSNRYMVRWSKSKFYNAVDTFTVRQGPSSNYSITEKVKATRDPNDTLYQVSGAAFGDNLNFTLRLVPKKTNVVFVPGAYWQFESTTTGTLGFDFKKYMDVFPYIFQVKKDEFVYYNCERVTRYSLSQRREMETMTYEPTGCSTCRFVLTRGSNSGKYLTSFVDCNRDILFANGKDLNSYSVHKLQNITNGSHMPMAVSDTGTAIIQNIDGGLNLYDLSASTPLAYYKKNYRGDYAEGVKISSNGEYFFVQADTLRLVHFKNNQFTDAWKQPYPNNIKFYEFDPFHPERVIFWNGSRLSVKSCSDLSVVNEYDLNDEGLLDIDYYNDEMLTCTKGHLLVRSFSDGTLLKDIPVNFDPMNWAEACYLVDHTIVYGRGLLYFIYPGQQ